MGQPLPPPQLGTCYFVNPALTSYLFIYLCSFGCGLSPPIH